MSDEHSQKPLTIRELPRSERPRERLIDLGAGVLSSAELLAILLGSGGTGHSALEIGQAILAGSGGALRRIARQPVAALTAVPGVGQARAVMIHASLELGRRMAAEGRPDGTPIRAPRDVVEYFGPRMQDLGVEEFHVAVLDSQHRLERDVLVTRGILNSALVHPREVFREAIAERAAAIVLVHNHPSGDPIPSADDRAVTEQLVAAGRLLDIPVHDHVIIGRGRYVSFAESGLLWETGSTPPAGPDGEGSVVREAQLWGTAAPGEEKPGGARAHRGWSPWSCSSARGGRSRPCGIHSSGERARPG